MEKRGRRGTLICLDGAPNMLHEMCEQEMKTGSEAEFETVILCHLMALYVPVEIILENRVRIPNIFNEKLLITFYQQEKIYKCNSFEERLDLAQKLTSKDAKHSPEYQRKAATAFYTRLKELRNYYPKYPKILSSVRLFKPSNLSVQNVPEDYKLSELCANLAEVKVFEGNHLTLIENTDVADTINNILSLKVPSDNSVRIS